MLASSSVKGQQQKVTAVLEIVMGDNLSSHAVAGFQTHFNSGLICRYSKSPLIRHQRDRRHAGYLKVPDT